jgi:hypothetical protein
MNGGLRFGDYNFSGIKLLNLREIEINVAHLAENRFNFGKLKTIPRNEENVL